MHLRSFFWASMMLALLAAVPVQAAITIDVSDPVDLAAGGLQQFTVSAVATEGELISGFGQISVTGDVHQVWQVSLGDPLPTLGITQTEPAQTFPEDWAPYDTHILIGDDERVGNVGNPPVESNDLSTAGTLGLSQAFGMDAPSGFGEIVSDGTDGMSILPELQGQNVPFLQVVTTAGTAYVDVNVGLGDSREFFFERVQCGGGPVIPEPASIALVGLALVGCVGFARRRR